MTRKEFQVTDLQGPHAVTNLKSAKAEEITSRHKCGSWASRMNFVFNEGNILLYIFHGLGERGGDRDYNRGQFEDLLMAVKITKMKRKVAPSWGRPFTCLHAQPEKLLSHEFSLPSFPFLLPTYLTPWLPSWISC